MLLCYCLLFQSVMLLKQNLNSDTFGFCEKVWKGNKKMRVEAIVKKGGWFIPLLGVEIGK